ncbi:SRPBCC family protein [Spirosoma sp. KNUC1025]|uniref:SRPBCC family protein n=1 Tax=Spirosoma sp. KNUC1025 TaxID=2894082 RepID=UPI003864197C|nr:SRPBCC family protein [Spirosoma sp. KNUC1025]
MTTNSLTPVSSLQSNTYHFITEWHVTATPEEVYCTLEDVDALARWWPSVYLDVRVLEKGQAGGVGKVVELYTKGWLPYTLRWKFRVTQTAFPNGFSLEAFGDFVGRGIWTFKPDNSGTHVTYDWQIEAEKPILKKLSWLLKPIFSLNHEWAMRKGLESLQLELRRRQGGANVAKPPQPTFPHNLTNNRILNP